MFNGNKTLYFLDYESNKYNELWLTESKPFLSEAKQLKDTPTN